MLFFWWEWSLKQGINMLCIVTPEHEIFAYHGPSFALSSFNLTSILLLFLSGTVDWDAAGMLSVPVYYC